MKLQLELNDKCCYKMSFKGESKIILFYITKYLKEKKQLKKLQSMSSHNQKLNNVKIKCIPIKFID